MRAIRQYEFGGPEVLVVDDVPDPHPAPGQVRIRAETVGVHLIDTALRRGLAGGPLPPPELPTIPGREVAGVVDEVGDGVDRGWLGVRAVAHLGPASAGYAELAVREVDAVHALPADLDAGAAVAMIGTGRTTMGILDQVGLVADDVVVVTAAAGGVGTLLLQAVRAVGATAVGLAGGSAKVERVRATGADVAVDYDDDGWDARVRDALGDRRATVVLDGVGGERGRSAMEMLGPGGRLWMFGWSSGTVVPLTGEDLAERGLTAGWLVGPAMLRRRSVRSLEEQALAEAAAGRLVPLVQSFPFDRAADAHRALEERATVGKVVLVP